MATTLQDLLDSYDATLRKMAPADCASGTNPQTVTPGTSRDIIHYHYIDMGVNEEGVEVAKEVKKVIIHWKGLTGVEADEAAEDVNKYKYREESDKKTTAANPSAPTLEEIARMYGIGDQVPLHRHVKGAMIKAANAIGTEALKTTNLSSNAIASDKSIAVDYRYDMYPGKIVVITDDDSEEEVTITRVVAGAGNTGTIHFSTGLLDGYLTNKNAKITYRDNKEREDWAENVGRNVAEEFSIFMVNISMNSTVLGGSPSDNDIEYLVNQYIPVRAARYI